MSENSSSPGSRRTSTSTVIYSQEPFITFAPKAIKLIERLVLRIPRFDRIDPEIADQVAVLRYIESLKTIPVPHTTHFDITDQNPLGLSYVIQNRVEGHTLQSCMANLTQEKRLEITMEVAKITAQIFSTAFEHIGSLCASSADSSQDVGFVKLEYSTRPEPFSNTLDFLVKSFNSRTLDVQSRDPTGTHQPSYWSRLKEVARTLNMKRPFTNKFCLLHNDFMARNILVKENADRQLIITAILDWDFAAAAPIEAACVVPHWLWTWTPGEEDGIVEIADETPTTPELQAVKELFEKEIELLVPGFTLMWREGFLSRELFYFAINGFCSVEDFDRADRLVEMTAAL